MLKNENDWDLIIQPRRSWLDIDLPTLWAYRNLIGLFVKRDFVTFYKQTILGPIWYLIQPLFNAIVFTVIFGKIAKISTDGVPPFIFYMSGNIIWGYFSHCINGTSTTFTSNVQVFGKIYFPRLTVPISTVITGLFQFLIQFILFLCFYMYFLYKGSDMVPNIWVITLPLLLINIALLGLGIGLLVSSLTTRYRDLSFATGLFIQLWMYLTPIVYPLSEVPADYRLLYSINPMVAVVECFRYTFLGVSALEWVHVAVGLGVTFVAVIGGVLMFNKNEQTFMDTI
jgi:lipopolysaccharide transport system permease protein